MHSASPPGGLVVSKRIRPRNSSTASAPSRAQSTDSSSEYMGRLPVRINRADPTPEARSRQAAKRLSAADVVGQVRDPTSLDHLGVLEYHRLGDTPGPEERAAGAEHGRNQVQHDL